MTRSLGKPPSTVVGLREPGEADARCLPLSGPGLSSSLTVEIRQAIYDTLCLRSDQRTELEAMVAGSPARTVATAAKTNVRAFFASKKNGAVCLIESHTCELAYAYELELDPDVRGYYTQVRLSGVRRERERLHVSAATLDFLVFRGDSIEIVECKYQDALLQLATRPDAEYIEVDGEWTHRPYRERAGELGLRLRVWVQTKPVGIYLQNLEACYAHVQAELSHAQAKACEKALRQLRERPASISKLAAMLPHFNAKCALWLMANGKAYGTLRSASPADEDEFYLFRDPTLAQAVDQARYASLQDEMSQPNISDELLNATNTDLRRGMARLQRLERIEAGLESPSIRMRQLAKEVAAKTERGMSPLAACLTNYKNCGSSTPSPLSEYQREAIQQVIKDHWNSGDCRTVADLHLHLRKWCEAHGQPTPSATTLGTYVRRKDPAVRAFALGGFRWFHAVRHRTGGEDRSLPPLGFGQVLAIDSSQFDVRCAPNLVTAFPAEKPRFYVACDLATGHPMAHSFTFGPASRVSLALLLREHVHRHGRLPLCIHMDRGPENTSKWILWFGRQYGITVRHSPTGNSQGNGQAEAAIKQVNAQTAHKLPGSTEPDMAGRKVDGKYKSRRTAQLSFKLIHREFTNYLYCDVPRTPDSDGFSPADKRRDALERYGKFGRSCQFDDAFLINTSIPLDRYTASEKYGVRTGDGYFTSRDLQIALRHAKPEEVRADCANWTVLWVKIRDRWFKAFHGTAQKDAVMSQVDRLFNKLQRRADKRDGRRARVEIAFERFRRREQAIESELATSHLAPSNDIKQEAAMPDSADGERAAVDWAGAPEY